MASNAIPAEDSRLKSFHGALDTRLRCCNVKAEEKNWCCEHVQFLVLLTCGILSVSFLIELHEWLSVVLGGWVQVVQATSVGAKLLHSTSPKT